jgi:ArsR family transcriptional regulator
LSIYDGERGLETMTRRTVAMLPADCCAPVGAARLPKGQAETLAQLFKALADPTRVRMVNLLANSGDPVCVCDFEEATGLSQGTVSHHLKRLLQAGLVEREQRGTWAYYSLRRGALAGLASVFELEGATA